ncbi:MAG: hypothetical protein HQK78_17455 [Desulfobacterales bacterium]|nr:hypothetical protein [Desulfobacterales bacterium]
MIFRCKHIIFFAEKDDECKEERAYQEITGIINKAQKTDNSSWKNLIKSIIDFSSQSNEWFYTYSKFNRRYFSNGIYTAGRAFKEKQFITVAIDVSGSMVMNPDEIEVAFGVIEDMTRKYKIHLVCLDEELFIPEKIDNTFYRSKNLKKGYIYKKGDWKFIKSGTGGTTFFAPLFNNYMKSHHEMLVVITDGYIYDLNILKKYTPTLWVISGNRTEPFYPPFGQVVSIKALGA